MAARGTSQRRPMYDKREGDRERGSDIDIEREKKIMNTKKKKKNCER